MAHFHPFSIKHWGNPWLLITPKENKTNGVLMSQCKNKLNPVEPFTDSDDMKIDRIHCLNDSESCWTASFIGKILTRKKWLLRMC